MNMTDGQYGVLQEQIKTLSKRVDNMESTRDLMYSLDKNMALQTQLMENVVQHNKIQDEKMEDFQKVIVSVNENLTKLNEGQNDLTERVDNIENQVEKNELKHLVDLREIEKDKQTSKLKQYGLPVGTGVAIGTLGVKVLEVILNYVK